MKTITITANDKSVTNNVVDFKIEGLRIYVKGLEGEFKLPFATDNATIQINDNIIETGADGWVMANSIKYQLDNVEEWDEVYDIYIS